MVMEYSPHFNGTFSRSSTNIIIIHIRSARKAERVAKKEILEVKIDRIYDLIKRNPIVKVYHYLKLNKVYRGKLYEKLFERIHNRRIILYALVQRSHCLRLSLIRIP